MFAFYAFTAYTCTQVLTHADTPAHWKENTELLSNGDQFTNCMQDVKQGSHPWLSTKFHCEALYIYVMKTVKKNLEHLKNELSSCLL